VHGFGLFGVFGLPMRGDVASHGRRRFEINQRLPYVLVVAPLPLRVDWAAAAVV